MKGMIFDVKEFAVFDGPGIRQTVFLKGCPLRCRWCHNPEGLCAHPQLMVGKGSCLHCGKCREVCEYETCICCAKCVQVCPQHLRIISGEELTSEELAGRISRNSGYYARYGGGVTFSGGEPLMQAEFLMEVLDQLPDLHCAVETSGYCSQENFRQVVSRLDYVLIDLKLFDAKKHKHYTGVDNERILENIKMLCGMDIPFVVRVPLIPGVNDNEKNLRQTAEWIAGAGALQKVELLPYQKVAGAKYVMLDSVYRPPFDAEQEVWIPRTLFEEYGIRSEVL